MIDDTRVDTIWSPVEIGHRQKKVIKKKRQKGSDMLGISCVSRRLVRIVVKFNNDDLSKLNDFLKLPFMQNIFS